jgi:hypothetical protein
MRPHSTNSAIPFHLLLNAVLGLFLCSCSGIGFHRAWKKANAEPPADPFCGQWQGTWLSEFNQHNGKLRCVVSPPESPGEPHHFHYHATWMRILSGSYRARHTITPSGTSKWTLKGQHQMPGWAGGLYTYEGQLSPTSFNATYRCALDHGTFTLSRPESPLPSEKALAKPPPAP